MFKLFQNIFLNENIFFLLKPTCEIFNHPTWENTLQKWVCSKMLFHIQLY